MKYTNYFKGIGTLLLGIASSLLAQEKIDENYELIFKNSKRHLVEGIHVYVTDVNGIVDFIFLDLNGNGYLDQQGKGHVRSGDIAIIRNKTLKGEGGRLRGSSLDRDLDGNPDSGLSRVGPNTSLYDIVRDPTVADAINYNLLQLKFINAER